MAQWLAIKASEESTLIVTCAFQDEDGVPTVPATMQWTLRNMAGEIINNREDVVVTPVASVDIILTGDDLAVPDSTDLQRALSVTGTYDSTLGEGLSFSDVIYFNIESLLEVAIPTAAACCTLYEYCYDQSSQTPLPAVRERLYIVALPHNTGEKVVTGDRIIGTYNNITGLLQWSIPVNAVVHVLITQLGYNHTITIPDADSIRLFDLL